MKNESVKDYPGYICESCGHKFVKADWQPGYYGFYDEVCPNCGSEYIDFSNQINKKPKKEK